MTMSAPIEYPITPEGLLALEDGDFYDCVDDDVRGELDIAVAINLRTVEVAERWYQTLIQMKKNVEATLAARKIEDRGHRVEIIGRADREVEKSRQLTTPGNQAREKANEKDQAPQGQPTTADRMAEQALGKARQFRRQADEEYAKYLKWRTGALRFRSAVEERVQEAKWRRHVAGGVIPAHLLEERRMLEEQVLVLIDAINEHRDAIDDEDATPADRVLWNIITPNPNLIRPRRRKR